MIHLKTALICLFCLAILSTSFAQEKNMIAKSEQSENSKLLVLWTSGDRDVALNMVFMYTYNAKKYEWWDSIRLIVWGPSAKLLAEDEELQQEIKKMKAAGIELFACKACSDRYEVSEKLQELGINVKYIGKDFTEMLKNGWTVLTF
jgi:hypothetical protein